MSVCIQYSRPVPSLQSGEIIGFDVAVGSLLSAYFRYSAQRPFVCRPHDLASFDHFKALAAAAGVDADKECVGLNPHYPEKNLQSLSCVFQPDPMIGDLIWRRQQMRGRGFATCGLVHTMSGASIAAAVGDLCIAPSDASDALICPSHAIRDAVRRLWDIQGDYLNHRFGGGFSCPVQTPVIPLGIDCDKFARMAGTNKRVAQRAALGVGDDEIVILFAGRMSFATKAHPLPLFMAAERAARQTGRKVRLVMYGYFKPPEMEKHFRDLAADLCQTVSVAFVVNDDARFPDGLWAGADIFASLADNVQESFGLTPIEAMACGLPAVISDWDGYREGVRNGEEGFLIPTVTPPASAGMALARHYYNDGNYGVALAGAAQSTGVDIEWCATAFAVLIMDTDKRREMGAKGRQRAREVFDWRPIMRAYDELWNGLSAQRLAMPVVCGVPEQWQAVHPDFPNPWQMFGAFPTTQLRPSDLLHIAMDVPDVAMLLRHEMNYFVPELLLPREQVLELIGIVRQAETIRIQAMLTAFPADRHEVLWRCIGWMIKHGICRMERV